MGNNQSKLLRHTLPRDLYHLHKAIQHYSHAGHSEAVHALYSFEVKMLGEANARTAWLCNEDPSTKKHARMEEDDMLERAGIDVGKMTTEDWKVIGSVVCLDLAEAELRSAEGAMRIERKDGAAHGLERMLEGLRQRRAQ